MSLLPIVQLAVLSSELWLSDWLVYIAGNNTSYVLGSSNCYTHLSNMLPSILIYKLSACDHCYCHRADCDTLEESAFSFFDGASTCVLSTDERIGVFTMLIAFVIVAIFVRAVFFSVVCVQASARLHRDMFASIIRARVHFFDINPIGKTKNYL